MAINEAEVAAVADALSERVAEVVSALLDRSDDLEAKRKDVMFTSALKLVDVFLQEQRQTRWSEDARAMTIAIMRVWDADAISMDEPSTVANLGRITKYAGFVADELQKGRDQRAHGEALDRTNEMMTGARR